MNSHSLDLQGGRRYALKIAAALSIGLIGVGATVAQTPKGPVTIISATRRATWRSRKLQSTST